MASAEPPGAASGTSSHPDRAWRFVRWVVACLATLASVAVLVGGGFVLYYAKKASDQNAAAQVRSAREQVAKNVAKTAALIAAANKAITQTQQALADTQKSITQSQQKAASVVTEAQKNVAAAKQELADTEAKAGKSLADLQASVTETNQELASIAQSQKAIEQSLVTLTTQLTRIDKKVSQAGSAKTR